MLDAVQDIILLLVPTERLELSRLSPPPPQDGVSTNSTTSALHFVEKAGFAGQNRQFFASAALFLLLFAYFGMSFVFESGSAAGLSGVGTGTSELGAAGAAGAAGCVAITPLAVPLCE